MELLNHLVADADQETLVKLAMDGLRRTIVHYGHWFAQVEHQLGLEKALELEQEVWDASAGTQLQRLGKTLGFPVRDGAPEALHQLPRETLIELLKGLGVNWLANDGIWFQAVERACGMNDAKRCNDSCWTRYSPFEAARTKALLGLPENGGLEALKKALAFRMYALVNRQSIEDVDEHSFIFRMNACRVQTARKRKGLEDYACKSVGLVEYPYFARAIDPRITTECVGCPPDPHPEDWYCAWKFTLGE
ncbi:MAG: DUF6125 family protein [Deferrisomatales bacterium]|nr:DUF6125 family protein [Deferrisomatales bacterium]